MSTLFEVPCPECGRLMSVAGESELRCTVCERTYHVNMGHLFPMDEPPDGPVVAESPPGLGAAGLPTAAAP